jgi:multidrug transporter EmrE-like cation transporter
MDGMISTTLRSYLFVILALSLTIYGQLVVKWRVDHAGNLPNDAVGQLRFALRLLVDPWIVSAAVLTLVAALGYFVALTHLPLSRAYPVMALSFVGVVIASAPLYGETLTPGKLLGLVVMMTGVLIATRA